MATILETLRYFFASTVCGMVDGRGYCFERMRKISSEYELRLVNGNILSNFLNIHEFRTF